MKILITGINGFVGKHLREILTQLSYQVWGVDYISQSEEVFSVDICNKLQMEEIVNRIKPDCVYHLAAASFVDDQNVDAIYDVNVKGTLNVLASCCTLDKLPRFIFISSSQVYGNVPDELQPIVEDMPLNPVNHYGASKAIGEMLVKLYSTEYGLEYVIFRPFNHTGVGQNEIFVILKIIKAFKENLRCIELGNIDVERDFCDVRDVVRAY
ncbi:MAG: GDP-mannose 4,6-dehydratase, partial [Spirochaetes bacterium]|nr:GDP-mannose 4,6-dehydratase [Spirochaetota bacterium]